MATLQLFDSSSESEDEFNERKERRFRERINYCNITDPHQYKEKFRICGEAMEYLLTGIGNVLLHKTSRNYALSPDQQIKTALHWLGNGSQYHGIADMHGLHKSTVQRCVKRVTAAIMDRMFAEIVRWPDDGILSIPQNFMKYSGFPRVAGCVDGTIIPINAPKLDEKAYVDRYGQHSLNCMVVCGPKLEFYFASARWPGSTHDSRVLRRSSLFQKWEVNSWRPFAGAVLLGDSGYPLLSWLMTPIERPGFNRDGMRRYLLRHRSTRRLVENAIGILKEKFPCLNLLRLKPEVAGRVILSCVTLCNIEKMFIDVEVDDYEEDDCTENNADNEENITKEGVAVYTEFQSLFANQ